MDNLRLTLQTLFQHRQLPLQKWLRLPPNREPHCSLLDIDQLVHEMRTLDSSRTLDELKNIVNELEDIWMLEGTDQLLSYNNHQSVFNVLLHFVSPLLVTRMNQPVVHYEGLFRWHDLTQYLGEDLLVTSFLAARDAKNRTQRVKFDWDEYLPHDNTQLNHILEKETSELHAHLNGSSYGFALNWLCLMNHIDKGYNAFEMSHKMKMRLFPNIAVVEGEYSLQLMTAKAAFIRFYLIATEFGENKIDSLNQRLYDALLCDNQQLMKSHLQELQKYIRTYCQLHAVCYKVWGGSHYVDYAIQLNKNILAEQVNDANSFMTVLAGERWFLYSMLTCVYKNSANQNRTALLFYIYLLIKNKFRREFIQLNGYDGFENFSEYQDRKEWFLTDEIYQRLNTLLAVNSYYLHTESRYVEMRVTPAKNMIAMYKKTRTHDINQQFGITPSTLGDTSANNKRLCNYIVHFIKHRDKKTSTKLCRNAGVRSEVEHQAKTLARLMSFSKAWERMRIVGIDAASSELACRPEVFAQAFRYLQMTAAQNGQDIGQTYHVGEDFYDIVDGLRAIDEVLLFMQFRGGCRMGHALALGTDVCKYYHRRHDTAVMPAQVLLDNIVWLYERSIPFAKEYQTEREWLMREYESKFQMVFSHWTSTGGSTAIPSIYTYYQSWMLRGDNPEYYHNSSFNPETLADDSPWNRCGMVRGSMFSQIRIGNINARLLCHRYHFDEDVKARGIRTVQWKIPYHGVFDLIDAVREQMLREVEERHIHIECNPTSNLRIGSFNRYDELPVSRFFDYGLPQMPSHPSHGVSISINTDDKGVFATSLEREYSLVALAGEKRKDTDGRPFNQPQQVYDWLDRIREMSVEAKFGQ